MTGPGIFVVPSSRKWINQDGSPTTDFLLFITALFNATSGAGVPTGSIQSNISGGTAAPVGNTLPAILDATIGNARGDILVRGASIWGALPIGSANRVLSSNGADVVYAAVVNSITGASGLAFSSGTGAVSVTLTSALVLASGAPASITTAGGDLALRSATGNVQVGTAAGTVTLGANSGVTKFGQTFKSSAVAANFSASRFITVLDGTGTIYYIPAATAAW